MMNVKIAAVVNRISLKFAKKNEKSEGIMRKLNEQLPTSDGAGRCSALVVVATVTTPRSQFALQ